MKSTYQIIELLPSLPYSERTQIFVRIFALAWKHSDWKGRAALLLTTPEVHQLALMLLAFIMAVMNSIPR